MQTNPYICRFIDNEAKVEEMDSNKEEECNLKGKYYVKYV